MTSIPQIRPAPPTGNEHRRASRNPEPSLEGAGVWLVIPCYKVRAHILDVIAKTPAWIEGVVCVDDACPENSGDLVESEVKDPRVVVVKLPQNRGVGGATMAGYAEAAARGAQVLVKVDGDDQMDLDYVGPLVAPILLGEADYAKGNRFTSVSHVKSMPGVRIFGNTTLSFLAKLSTGYWNIFDPTNGFTAIDAEVARIIVQKRVATRFFFETDLLYQLGTVRAVVRDVPMPARYAHEVSNIRIPAIVGPFAYLHLRNFLLRILGQYFVRDFHVASLELLFGLAGILFGLGYGLTYMSQPHAGPAPAGVVMAAALPIILGAQFLLQAVNFDVVNTPTRPIHPYLRTLARLAAEERRP